MRPPAKPIFLTISVLFILLFLFANSPARAAHNNPVFATIEYVQQAITNALSPLQSSMQGLTNRVSNLESTVTPIPAQIADLQNQASSRTAMIHDLQTEVQSLKNTQPPQPTDFTFLSGVFPATGGTTSPIFDAQGYTKIAFTWNCPVGATPILLEASPDQVLWGVQAIYGNPDHCNDSSVTLNTAGRYYKVVLGGSTNFTSITVNAFGHFFN